MTDTFSAERVAWVTDLGDVPFLLTAIETAAEVVIDLETTGLAEHATTGGAVNGGVAARIALASLTLPQPEDEGDPTTWVVPLSHPDSPLRGQWRSVMRQIAQTIVAAGRPVVNHNMKFDARWIVATTGVDVSGLIEWDTQMGAHLFDENVSKKLKEVVPRIFDVQRWDDFDLTYPGAAEDVPLFDLGLYAARDTYWTWKLAQWQRDQLFIGPEADEPLGPDEMQAARLGRLAVACSMPTIRTLTAIEQRGLLVDPHWIETEVAEHEARLAEVTAELSTRYSHDVDGNPLDLSSMSFAPTSLWFIRWAAAAVAAGDLRVAALTPTGKPQWGKSVLGRQARGGSSVAEALLDLRGYSKRLEFLRAWLAVVTAEGRVHSTYNADVTVTGRLSSSSPNMQQVTKALKPAFVPSTGHLLADLDYSQIELRVAAFISRCEPMLEAFNRGDDLHRLLAARITGKKPEEVTPTERQAGKSANFGLLYGMSAGGFREYAEDVYGVEFTDTEAVAVREAFFDTWDGIRDWHNRAITRVQRQGEVTSPLGRVRRLPAIWDGNPRRVSEAERAAINSPVQGFASDLMQMAAASIEGTLIGVQPVRGARLVGTVHDSILVEVPQEDWEAVADACRHRMEQIGTYVRRHFGVEIDVPLVADVTVGTRWGLSDVSDAATPIP